MGGMSIRCPLSLVIRLRGTAEDWMTDWFNREDANMPCRTFSVVSQRYAFVRLTMYLYLNSIR